MDRRTKAETMRKSGEEEKDAEEKEKVGKKGKERKGLGRIETDKPT